MSGSEDLLHENASDAYKKGDAQERGDRYWQSVYELGRGYEEDGDPKRAFTYYEMAASNGNPAAKLECGKCLYFGKGTERDLIRASVYLQDAEAIYEEARTCYFDRNDIERAIYLLNLPAAR